MQRWYSPEQLAKAWGMDLEPVKQAWCYVVFGKHLNLNRMILRNEPLFKALYMTDFLHHLAGQGFALSHKQIENIARRNWIG